MKPEEKARKKIDQLLDAAGWEIQDRDELNLGASLGVAVREFPLKPGPVDYLLFVDREAVGVIEAKRTSNLQPKTRESYLAKKANIFVPKPVTLEEKSKNKIAKYVQYLSLP